MERKGWEVINLWIHQLICWGGQHFLCRTCLCHPNTPQCDQPCARFSFCLRCVLSSLWGYVGIYVGFDDLLLRRLVLLHLRRARRAFGRQTRRRADGRGGHVRKGSRPTETCVTRGWGVACWMYILASGFGMPKASTLRIINGLQ